MVAAAGALQRGLAALGAWQTFYLHMLPRPGAALAFPGDDHPMAPITETPANAETFAYAARLRVIYG